MRYELNFDEDKIIDIEAIGDNGVFGLKDCCKIMNEQQSTIIKQDEEIKKLKRTERSWRRIHCCNKESDNCGIVIEQEATIKQLEGEVKSLNAFIVHNGFAEEYIQWKREGDV